MNPKTLVRRCIAKLRSQFIATLSERSAESLIIDLEHRIGIGSGAGADRSGEQVAFDVLQRCGIEKQIIFDVGANQGLYTSAALSRTRDPGTVEIHCFEPSKHAFDILQSKHGANKSIKLCNFGLADVASHSTLFMNKEGSGLASLTKRRLEHFGVEHGRIEEQVQLRTLDEYCETTGVVRIHLLKIDVEGHELDVLRGAASLLKHARIDLIQFEFGGCNIDTRSYFQDFFYFFQNYGFRLFRILPQSKLLRLPDYREIDEKFRTSNYLAVKNWTEIETTCCDLIV